MRLRSAIIVDKLKQVSSVYGCFYDLKVNHDQTYLVEESYFTLNEYKDCGKKYLIYFDDVQYGDRIIR